MKVLDVDLDFFLNDVAYHQREDKDERLDSSEYAPWRKQDVICFIQNKLGLSKHKKIKGRIIKHHNEALDFWMEKIKNQELETPFDVVHVDAHADLGMGSTSYIFIHEQLLSKSIDERKEINNYSKMFDIFKTPQSGDYLLYALAFRFIRDLTYVYHMSKIGDDFITSIMQNYDYNSDKIQLTYIKDYNALDIYNNYSKNFRKKIWENSKKDPEVNFKRVKGDKFIDIDCKYDFITFCQSPNYTPKESDFIIDIFKEYIDEI